MLTHLKQNFNHINNNTGDNNSINLCNDTKTESFGYQQQQQYPPYEDQKVFIVIIIIVFDIVFF